MRQFVRLAAVVTASLCLAGATSIANAERPSPSEQRCITKVARGGAKVATVQAVETRSCMRAAASGLLDPDDGQTCQRSDSRSRIGDARAKLVKTASSLCASPPPFGYTSAATVADAAVEQEISLSVDLFGDSLALGAVPSRGNPDGARCQASVLGASEKALAFKVKTFGKCLRLGLKVGSIVQADRLVDCVLANPFVAASAVDAVRAEVLDSCAGLDSARLFPGRCAASADDEALADCVGAVVECRTCRMMTAMHGITADCDDLDDGIHNASCGGGPVTTTTTTSTTTSTTLVPPVFTVCGNPADQAVDAGYDLFVQATNCTYTCLAAGDLPHCVASCVTAATGLSPACALCYGQSSKCGITNCIGQCAANQSAPACTACLDTNCIPAFNACGAVPIDVTTTLPPPTTTTLDTTTTTTVGPPTTTTIPPPTTTTTIPLAGYCTDPSDTAIRASADVDGATRTCTFSCLVAADVGQCITDCVATATGLSTPCAGCFSDSAICGISHCAGACAANPNSVACLSCVQTNCAAAQNACIGVPPTTTTTLDTTTTTTTTTTLDTTTTTLPPVTGACTNPADVAVDVLFDMQAQATSCTVGCLSAPDRVGCVRTCVATNTGASTACSGCYADTAECGLQNCANQCALNQSAPPCLACLDAHCVTAFDACSGLGEQPLPPSCSNGSRDGHETDTDCGGDVCAQCVIGDTCTAPTDCVSGECVTGICSAPTTELAFGSCANGYIDPFSDPDALDLGAFGTGSDDGYVVQLPSPTEVYVQLTNKNGSTSVIEAAMLAVAGNAASAAPGLGTGTVVAGQNGTAGPTNLAAGTYYLYVDSATAGTYGPYDICVLPAPTIAMGSCVSMSVGNGDGNDIALAGAGGDKGFRFSTTSSTNVILKLRNLSGDATMAAGLYDSGALVSSSSTGTTPLFTERVTGLVPVVGNRAYTVQVDTAAIDTSGTFEVCVVQAGCGDGIRTGAETCDDGNHTAGDGCSATCTLESGKLVVDSCRSDNIPLIGNDCDDWTMPILENEGVYLEVTNPAGGTLLAKGSIRSGSTQLVATGNIAVGQSGSTAVTNLSAGSTYTARVCDVTGAGTGNYTVCARSARKVELGACYAGNVTDGDGNAINLAGPISGGDEDVLLQPPRTTTARLTMSNKSGTGLLASGVYTGQPGSLLAGSSVGASPSPIATGASGQSGLFSLTQGQIYRVYTDIASLGTAGSNYEICLAEVAGDACLNPEDELVKSSFNLDEEASSTGVSCSGGAACISSAMQADTGLSAGCADCYGGTGACAASNCALQCLSDSGSSGCRSCVASNCAQEFEICSGWSYQN